MKNHLCKLPDVRSVLLAVFKMIFICFLLTLLFIYTLDDGARRKFTTLFLLREGLVFINTSTTSSEYVTVGRCYTDLFGLMLNFNYYTLKYTVIMRVNCQSAEETYSTSENIVTSERREILTMPTGCTQ
jgi:hypothetical protein